MQKALKEAKKRVCAHVRDIRYAMLLESGEQSVESGERLIIS